MSEPNSSSETPRRNYITLIEALAFHAVLINKYGGTSGIRDMGALEGAINRPQSGYYKDLVEEAAALLESLAVNHSFIDGNKRVAFACVDIFARINGYSFTHNSEEIYQVINGLFEEGKFRFEFLEPWLRKELKRKK